ncbi:MAG TPA: MFS transporter [Sphingomicrobium sp.]|nr:MFS transporter [Sphingomicrobium sp.]
MKRWIPAFAGTTSGKCVPEQTQGRSSLSGKQIAAVTAGNALEFYDFVTYTFFATQIGRALFPGNASQSLLLSLATFGVGFLTRPLGGIVIGRMADRRGRKPAMILTFTMMGIAMTGLALTPSYAAIGMAAPITAVAFRLLQGFALGGEVGPNIAFLMEAAPANRRGFYISLNFASADFAVLVAGLVGFGLASILTPAELEGWGWRVAFLLGASIVPVGLRIRRTLVETLPEEAEVAQDAVHGRALLLLAGAGLLIIAGATISNYTLDYLTTYAQSTLHMAVPTAFAATVILGVIGVAGDLAGGFLSDRFGAKRVLVLPWLLLIGSAIPVFYLLNQLRTPTALLVSTAVLTVFHILGSSPATIHFAEALPARARAGSIGIVYALAIALFGGTTQIVETLLIRWTGNPAAPGYYMMGAVVVALIGALSIPGRPRRDPIS